MITLKNVNKYFNRHKKNQVHVINNISLNLKNNGLVAFLGPSGCGKTTLLNVIGGLDKIKSGKIYIDNKKISSKCSYKVDKIRNINIGYIFQDYKLIDNLSVFDNVALVLTMIGIKDKKEIKKRVEYVLEKVGMERYKNRPSSMLSGGERQRVAVARAIVKDPDIILADEPTGNLDSKNSLEIMKIIKSISKERLVLLVTHEESLARFYADRIIELSDGKAIKDFENTQNDELDYEIDNNIYLKDIILWTLFSGLTICMNAVAGEADEKYISKVLKDNIRFTVVTEFLLSTFTFSFWVELIIIPITTVIVLFDTVAEHKSDAIAVHKLLQDVMAFAGLCVILQTVRVGILEYRELNVINTLVSFFIPIVYLLLVTPLEYAFELYSKYEMLFIQMHFKEPRDKKVKRKRHLKVIKACGLSVRKIILFQKQCIPRMYVSMSDSEFEALISQLEEICQ